MNGACSHACAVGFGPVFVLDLGSGSGIDNLLAALWVRPNGRVIGVNMTGRWSGGLMRTHCHSGLRTSSSTEKAKSLQVSDRTLQVGLAYVV